jgi:hypothetical protein
VSDETMPVTMESTPAAPRLARRSGWDFALMVVTAALLGALGVQSLLGTLYSWWAQRTVAGWASSSSFTAYIETMNAVAAPLLLALVVAIGLCVPRRLFSRWVLVGVSALMVVLGAGAWFASGDAATGMSAYLIGAAAIQVAVVTMTAVGSAAPTYLTEGRVTKVGSGLLHLGFIVFAYVVVALQSSEWMLPVFWLATTLCLVGTALSFYAGALTRALARRRAGD